MTTGNRFPASCYSVFKVMWYRDNEPEMFRNIRTIIGSKDWVNMRLTGRIVTDFSYASGSGIYSLLGWKYEQEFIRASGLSESLFPQIVPSTEIVGTLTASASEALGLPRSVKVACGGVDNSCMALGARNTREGRVYTSLGSSAWIAVSSSKPVLDLKTKPYVFTHVMPGMFTSAVSIFAAGRSFRWLRDVLCEGLNAAGWPVEKPKATMFVWARIPEAYQAMGSLEFSKKLLAEAKVAVAPGIGFGQYGDDHVRFGLIENEHRTRQAVRGIRTMMKKDGLVK